MKIGGHETGWLIYILGSIGLLWFTAPISFEKPVLGILRIFYITTISFGAFVIGWHARICYWMACKNKGGTKMTGVKGTAIFFALMIAACWILWTGFRNGSAFIMVLSLIPLYFSWKASKGAYEEITEVPGEKK